MKTNNTSKINSHKASKILKPLYPFPPAQSTPRPPGVSSVSGVSGVSSVSSSLLDQKKRLFLVQIGTKTVFQVFQSFQIRSQIPPAGRYIPQACNGSPSPKTPHIIYIYQRSLYRKGATTRPTQIGKRQRAHPSPPERILPIHYSYYSYYSYYSL